MKSLRPHSISLIICAAIVIGCLLVISWFSGFRYESNKFKQFLLTFFGILILHYATLEHVGLFIYAFILSKWPKLTEVSICRSDIEEIRNYRSSITAYLKVQLENLKADLKFDKRHQNVKVNLQYRLFTEELWLFIRYFILLFLMVGNSRNPYAYYNNRLISTALKGQRLFDFNTKDLISINNLYDFINSTLIQAVHRSVDYNDEVISEPGWLQFQLPKLLGVVRLQQMRHDIKARGMETVHFSSKPYMPGWQPYDRPLHYTSQYWRIYQPWLPKKTSNYAIWLYMQQNYGWFFNHWYIYVYETMLARDITNSQKILQFLKDYHWFDNLTVIVSIDFTLYNMDAQLFTICHMIIEQTPFASLTWQLKVDTVLKLINYNELSFWWWILIFLYCLQMIQFCKFVILKVWFAPKRFLSSWNLIDILMIVLNVIIGVLLVLRDQIAIRTLQELEDSTKIEFVDFKMAAVIDYIATLLLGVLTALTTIRIWKILQLFHTFRLFTSTLKNAIKPIFCTMMCIQLLLTAISLATQILNGNHTEDFVCYTDSLTTVLSFSFGFTSRSSAESLSKGSILGFLLYIVLMFGVAIFFINVFITIIIDYFTQEKLLRNSKQRDHITYWEFLQAEHAPFIDRLRGLCSRCYSKDVNSVKDFIERKLDELELKQQQQLQQEQLQKQEQEEEKPQSREIEMDHNRLLMEEDLHHIEHISKIIDILNVQMEILNRTIFSETMSFDSDAE